MSVTTNPRVQTGFQGEGRHIFMCRKYPFEILRSSHYPTPNENLIDENFVHKINLTQTHLNCENYQLGGNMMRIVGKVCTTVQTVANGAIVGTMQLKATVVRDLKLLFGTEALPGQVLCEKLRKYETSRDLTELRSMKTAPKKKKTGKLSKSEIKLQIKTEPTKKIDAKVIDDDSVSLKSNLHTFLAKFNPYRSKTKTPTAKAFQELNQPKLPQEPTKCRSSNKISQHVNHFEPPDCTCHNPASSQDLCMSNLNAYYEMINDKSDNSDSYISYNWEGFRELVSKQTFDDIPEENEASDAEESDETHDSEEFDETNDHEGDLDDSEHDATGDHPSDGSQDIKPTSTELVPENSWFPAVRPRLYEDSEGFFRFKRSEEDSELGLPSNFQSCGYGCRGRMCSCVRSYSGYDYWS